MGYRLPSVPRKQIDIEASIDRIAVGGQIFGVAQGADAGRHGSQSALGVVDDLLRSHEGV
jgi:hypothetical protein